MLCLVRQRSLRQADRSSRGGLPNVGCLGCDREAWTMMRTWPSRAVVSGGENE
jgi:hypothetical protein